MVTMPLHRQEMKLHTLDKSALGNFVPGFLHVNNTMYNANLTYIHVGGLNGMFNL